jgi:hypothetical protein
MHTTAEPPKQQGENLFTWAVAIIVVVALFVGVGFLFNRYSIDRLETKEDIDQANYAVLAIQMKTVIESLAEAKVVREEERLTLQRIEIELAEHKAKTEKNGVRLDTSHEATANSFGMKPNF